MTAAAFDINADGWCDGATWLQSPNCDARPPDAAISLLLVHNISLPPNQFGGPYIADLFANRLDYDAHPYFEQLRPLRVSAHFLIRRDGSVIQFVSADQRAWHAGVSSFAGRERCNDFSIGIEIEGSDFQPFEDAQYRALASLTEALLKRYRITDLAGHEHVAPGRKTDPGPYFDWVRYGESLRRGGLRQANGALPRMPIA
ncbi:MAG TPA: 1,6-anhydro-N-acetylmuramyl-L-alanine amidase AmpD [Herbaspirillum sp.]|jgi:AmpD protein